MDIIKYFPEEAKRALSNSGSDVIAEIGAEIIKDVVLNVLMGENIRNNTELLTRKRLLTLNAATLFMLIKGKTEDPQFIELLHQRAYERLTKKGVPKQEKWLLQWSLGLTDKAFQNVLRDDVANLESYKNNYKDVILASVEEFERDYGNLSGTVRIGDDSTELDWQLMSHLMTLVGSQTMAIRGSDKSTFGKLFEKLILGSLLSILGFKQVTPDDIGDGNKVFWLSERKDKRESDATILLEKGKGVRFDIGFIGRGNPEISLDKVSRFERVLEIDTTKYYMATIIIVDSIGANSRIETLAERIDGSLVQMSGAYWPRKVAQILNSKIGYNDEIVNLTGSELHELVKARLENVDFRSLVAQGFGETK